MVEMYYVTGYTVTNEDRATVSKENIGNLCKFPCNPGAWDNDWRVEESLILFITALARLLLSGITLMM